MQNSSVTTWRSFVVLLRYDVAATCKYDVAAACKYDVAATCR